MTHRSAADARVTDSAPTNAVLQRGARVQRQSRFEGLILDIRCPTPNSVCRCSAGGGGVAERWFQVLESDKTRWCRESQLQLQATAVRPRGNMAHDCGVCFPGDDCGACVVCLDKRKFGGPGTMRRGCLVWREWSSVEAAAAAKAAAAAQVIVAAGGPVEMTAAAETTAATVAVPAAVPAAATFSAGRPPPKAAFENALSADVGLPVASAAAFLRLALSKSFSSSLAAAAASIASRATCQE